jgi:hypothetical protein
MIFAAPRLGQDFRANEQAEFDADAGKADALTSYFGTSWIGNEISTPANA